jgi:hypothetical protein
MQGILRLLYWERTQSRLSQSIKALMKETVLGFKIFADVAADDTSVVESKIRQGLASKDWQGLWKNRDRFADFVVYRTPDYLLSGLRSSQG